LLASFFFFFFFSLSAASPPVWSAALAASATASPSKPRGLFLADAPAGADASSSSDRSLMMSVTSLCELSASLSSPHALHDSVTKADFFFPLSPCTVSGFRHLGQSTNFSMYANTCFCKSSVVKAPFTMARSVWGSYRLCAPIWSPRNLVRCSLGRFRDWDTCVALTITVLMPFPLPSTLPTTRGIL
jgi:hypothetical protein